MAKMMRPLLFLATMLLAAAEHSKLDCAVDGSKAFSDAADAAIYIWAATQRCGAPAAKAPVTGDPCAPTNRRLNPEGCESQRRLAAKSNAVACTIDISSAVAAVGSMTNIIVEALDTCDVIHSADEECGELAGELTTAAASLVAGSAGIVNACPNEFQPKPGNVPEPAGRLSSKTNLGFCIVDAKSSLSGTFDAMQSLKKIAGGGKQTHNALNTVSAFASLGSAVAAAVNDCSLYQGAGNNKADCVSNILGVVAQLHNVADIATSMSKKCKASASRLYLESSEDEKTSVVTNNSMSLALAAFLPVAAVFGFVGGRRFAKNGANREVGAAMIQVELE